MPGQDSPTFTGKIQIKKDAAALKSTIELDAVEGIVFAQSVTGREVTARSEQLQNSVRLDGNVGRIYLGNHLGSRQEQQTIQLAGDSGRIFAGNGSSVTMCLDGKNSRFFFAGDVFVNNSSGKQTIQLDGNKGDIALLNADCAEDFDIAVSEAVEPGTVMVIDEAGGLRPSSDAYDKKVAGVISGAGDLKPGMVLDRQPGQNNRMPVALMGKVYCKVDAQYAPIEVGDLLTTSPTLGHAMKATDSTKAFGTVIGKALRPLKEGQGLVPILIALQ